ncbi:MAG: acyl carrier protein [Deltaproteobacteria bacterium]|nr:acyl carrier protein [Deltaproteobacteria bacterium]
MYGAADATLKLELKTLIIETCRKKAVPDAVPDDAPLIGPGSALGLDSLDVLELSVVLKKRYGIRITDSKDAMRVMGSITQLAASIASGASRT